MAFISHLKNGQPILAVFVQPRASKNRFTALHDQTVKLAVTAPPVDGKANKAVISFLSSFFKIPKREIVIKSGKNSRNKRLIIGNLSEKEIRTKIMASLG